MPSAFSWKIPSRRNRDGKAFPYSAFFGAACTSFAAGSTASVLPPAQHPTGPPPALAAGSVLCRTASLVFTCLCSDSLILAKRMPTRAGAAVSLVGIPTRALLDTLRSSRVGAAFAASSWFCSLVDVGSAPSHTQYRYSAAAALPQRAALAGHFAAFLAVAGSGTALPAVCADPLRHPLAMAVACGVDRFFLKGVNIHAGNPGCLQILLRQ